MIIHNPDVQTLRPSCCSAPRNEGIYVIQINMGSSYRSSAFPSAPTGSKSANATHRSRSERLQGQVEQDRHYPGPRWSAAASAYNPQKALRISSPRIRTSKVVSSQAADWDAAKAKAHHADRPENRNPDLCGIVGFWDGMDIGTAAAVKEAGLTGKVFVATSGGGRTARRLRTSSSPAPSTSTSATDVPTAGRAKWAGMIKMAGLVRRQKPGSVKGSMYTTLIPITKENAASDTACWNLSDLKK